MKLQRHRFGATAVRLLSVTAAAATACTLWAGTASAATASVTRYATTTVVSVPKTGYTHTNITLSATEKGAGGNPTGTVTFWLGTRKLCHGSLYRRKTSCKAQFTNPGTKTITAKYSGNAMHKPSSGTAKITVSNKPVTTKSATTTTITSTDESAIPVGGSFTINVSVTSATGTPSGTVVLKPTAAAAGTTTCTATLTAGVGKCTVTPADYGIIYYTATYSGDATHAGSTSVGLWALEIQNVTKTTVGPDTAAAGTVALTVDVYAMGADITDGTGTVAFTNGSTPIAGCDKVTLATFDMGTGNNVGTCSTTLAAGTYTINVSYTGDLVNEPSNGTVTLVVS
ncbi:MAG TPA: Ig-like domain repeat protein [Streptosporangiaceae bacterium]|nr:Ig-like domain repeat protein [Streptosporangiaceae bacterium]